MSTKEIIEYQIVYMNLDDKVLISQVKTQREQN